jgi:hypothetical protein
MRQLFINGNFYTFNKTKPVAEAVAAENGRFIDLGNTDTILHNWKQPNSQVIDLEGKTATPGLIDSHLHLGLIAYTFINMDVTGYTSRKEMLEKIRISATELKPGEWLVGSGWDENLFTDGTIPTIDELDRIAPENPLFVSRICGHASIVNTKALEKSGYHKDIEVPEGGKIVLDEVTKQPTGLFLESASNLIRKHIPGYSYDVWKGAVKKAMKLAMSKGLTSVHTNDPRTLGGLDQTYRIYDELLNEDKLGLRCNLLINYEFLEDLHRRGMYTGFGNDTLQIGAVKLFSDGAFGRRTALLSEPYSDDPDNYGESMYDQKTIYNIVKRTRELDMPIAVHAIGDKGLENILDILDQFPVSQYRDRLIHTQVLRQDLFERLAHPTRIADIQPRFLASDFPWVQDRLGNKRIKHSYAWKSMMDAGIICAGGSDSPVEPVDPLLGIHAAVTRKTPGQTHRGYNPDEKLTMEQAFRLFTELGAYPTNEETVKGTIARGKLADMTVYSKNPFEMEDPDELLETDIEMTIIGGEVKYEKTNKSGR